MFVIGGLFVCVAFGSAFTAGWVNAPAVHWGALLSGLSQYAFVLLALPLIAIATMSGQTARYALRWIAVGYLPPMLVNLVFLRQEVLPQLSFMFVSVGRAIGTYGNANSFAGIIALVLPFYLYLAYSDRGRWKALGVIGAAVSLACMLFTASFGGLLVLVGCATANLALVTIWKQHPLRRSFFSVFVAALVIGALSIAILAACAAYAPDVRTATLGRFGAAASTTSETSATASSNVPASAPAGAPEFGLSVENIGSAAQRIDLIDRALALIKQRGGGLFYGHGLRQTTFMPEFQFSGISLDVHLVYLLLWIEGGAVLAALFFAYLLLVLATTTRSIKTEPAAAIAIASCVLAFILMGFVMPHIYLRYFWVPLLPAFALASGCFAVASKREDAAS